MNSLPLMAALLAYIGMARFALQRLAGPWRESVFAAVNVAGFYYFFFHGEDTRLKLIFFVYLALILLCYVALWAFAEKEKWKPWLAFFAPLLVLVVIRYVPVTFFAHWSHSLQTVLQRHPNFALAPAFVGLSYLAFRASHLVLEIRNGVVPRPGFWEYMGFCFFVPTMSVGPINPYSNYRRAFDAAPPQLPLGRSALRVLVGLVKFQFLGTLCNQLTYSGIFGDRHYHSWIDLPVAVLFYYLFLYCNFSGFCDMAIGAAGLIGIPVEENFNHPFAARNVKDFWNRWHITLSLYMRDVVFSPLSKFFARSVGQAHVNHAIAATIVVVFLLVGVWHGAGWNFAAYGAAHALGVVVNHYYTIGLKKWLGRDGFKAYNANPWIHAAAVVLTFWYCAATLSLFANTFPEMKEILSLLR